MDEDNTLNIASGSGLLAGATNPNGGTLTAQLALLKVRGTLGELWTQLGTRDYHDL